MPKVQCAKNPLSMWMNARCCRQKKNHPKGKDAFVSSRIYRVSFIRFWPEKLLHVLSQFGARNTKSRVPFVHLGVRIIQKARIIYGFWAAKKEEFWNGELVWKLSPTEPSTAELKGVFRGRRDYVQAGILYIILQKKSKKYNDTWYMYILSVSFKNIRERERANTGIE